ncbi:Chaperone protein DnaJ, partial [Bienertia sinuspersici]
MTTVTFFCLTPSLPSSSITLPFCPNPKSSISHSKKPNYFISRRHTSLLFSITPFLPYLLNSTPPAFAINLGISGPKEWLKEQKKKSVKYLLAPIDASDEILRHAYQLLLAKDANLEKRDWEEILGLLKSATRDCVAGDRNSLVAFQAKTGVE